MNKLIKTVAFRADVLDRLKALAARRTADRSGPRVSFNWLVNRACEDYLRREDRRK